jgi:xanthine/uracil permease
MLDLRIPSGWFFVLMGVILCTLGLFANYTAPLTNVNANLYAGLSMLIFGGILLWLARRAS